MTQLKNLLERAHEHDDNPDSHEIWSWLWRDHRRRLVSGITWLTWGVGVDVSKDWRSWMAMLTFGPFWIAYVVESER